MGLKEDIEAEVKSIFKSAWSVEATKTVPEPEAIKLGNHGKLIDGVVLYADLEDSTGLVSGYKKTFAAEVFKSFLLSACRVIRNAGGSITSFDGDRVMAIFVGESRNSDAAKVGLKINYAVQNVVNPALRDFYTSSSFAIKHVVGIDSGEVLGIRTGIRNNNDLGWIAPGANYAAKMCSIRGTSYRTIISKAVYERLNDKSKFGGERNENMWQAHRWTEESKDVYGSNWTWSL